MPALEQLRSTLSRGPVHLGDLAWWSLADARIHRSALEALWTEANLDLSQLPEPPTAEKALRSAAHEAAIGQPERLIRVAKQDEGEIIFGVILEHRDGAGSLSYRQEARVRLDRKTEAVSVDVSGHELADLIVARFAELRSTHTPDDVRRAMMKVLQACCAVTLRDHGGIYWVAAPYSDVLRRLQTAIEKIGSSRVFLLPIHDSADATKTLGEAAKLSIEEELAAMKLEIDAFVAEPPDRASTLVRRLDAFAALKSRAELYQSVLRVHVDDLDATLQTLSAAVEKLLDQKAAA